LRGDLIYAKLGSSEGYEALSYVWGESTHTHTMYLAGHLFPITANLEAALRGLRLLSKERIIWVDAICINQYIIEERNHQVGHMRHIYQQATTTLVWLGEQSENSHKAFAFVRELSQIAAIRNDDTNSIRQQESIVYNLLRLKDWKALDALLSRPWWMRVSVLQEVFMSARAIVICGDDKLEWEAFRPAMFFVTRNSPQRDRFMEDANRDTHHLHKYTLTQSFPEGEPDLCDIDLGPLLLNNKSKYATDPKDKVFALIGLATDGSVDSPNPDYSKSVELIYKETTKDIITRASSLAILEYAGISKLQMRLPSWCLDWTYGEGHHGETPIPISSLSDQFIAYNYSQSDSSIKVYGYGVSASGPITQTAIFDESLSILQVRGIRIDRIKALGEIFSKKNLTKLMDETTSLEVMCRNPYPTGEGCKVAIAQAQHAGFYWDIFGDGVDFYNVASMMFHAWTARRFVVTESGYVGLAPSDSKIGDEIFVVAGCNVPLIVRNLNGGYLLVGGSYGEPVDIFRFKTFKLAD
jgi:Heterokaryon incompatibility protein (HET)